MRAPRRFSQAISQGDGIAVLAEVQDAASARAADEEGAAGVVLRSAKPDVREATELPLLWCTGSLEDAHRAGADAYLIELGRVEDDEGELERLHEYARGLGIDCVVEVRDEDELRLALDRVDPEILLLTGRDAEADGGLAYVLGLLPDVPAGKLAVAHVTAAAPETVGELERAGVDAVIVPARVVSQLVGGAPPDV